MGALQFAAKGLKGDKEVVLATVQQNGYALEFTAKGLKGDKEVVLAAVQQNGYALEFAVEDLKGDKEVVLATVQQDWGFTIHWKWSEGGQRDCAGCSATK